MNYRPLLAFALFSVSASILASTSLCQEKVQDIQREIGYAEKHNNQNRIDGLTKARTQVEHNCSDSQLRADHAKEIAKQRDEIVERKQQLEAARQKGDQEKIAKQKHKLAEEQQALHKLEARKY